MAKKDRRRKLRREMRRNLRVTTKVRGNSHPSPVRTGANPTPIGFAFSAYKPSIDNLRKVYSWKGHKD